MNEQTAISIESPDSQPVQDATPVLCLVGTDDCRLWGMTCAQRLIRAFARHGIDRVVDISEAPSAGGPVILIRADAALDAPLVSALCDSTEFVLLGTDLTSEMPVAARTSATLAGSAAKVLSGAEDVADHHELTASRPEDLQASYWKSLRKRETPYALVVTAQNQKAVEWRMFMGTYKGATDFITKHVWPLPAFILTRLIAPLGVTPNMVTAVGAVFVVAAYLFFLNGDWVAGLLAGWLMTFLDTVDGKLARVTLTSSKWGDIFDHGIDLVHPPFWYTAWAIAIMAGPHPLSSTVFWWILTIILGGYLVQRIMEGISIKYFGLEIHVWRQIDTVFRQITARRNPNLAIMSIAVIISRPDWGLIAVAAWTFICLVLHGLQLLQARSAFRRNGNLQSWLSRSPTKP